MKTLVRVTTASALLIVGLALTLSAAEGLAEETPTNPNVDEAKGIVKAFATELQGELQAAIQEGGPSQGDRRLS